MPHWKPLPVRHPGQFYLNGCTKPDSFCT